MTETVLVLSSWGSQSSGGDNVCSQRRFTMDEGVQRETWPCLVRVVFQTKGKAGAKAGCEAGLYSVESTFPEYLFFADLSLTMM